MDQSSDYLNNFCRHLSRVEYDAFRSDFEQQRQNTQCDPVKLKEAEAKFQMHLEKFDQMRSDLSIKMKLLDENKVGICKVKSLVPYIFYNVFIDIIYMLFYLALDCPGISGMSWKFTTF